MTTTELESFARPRRKISRERCAVGGERILYICNTSEKVL